jgi:hypothetical protein
LYRVNDRFGGLGMMVWRLSCEDLPEKEASDHCGIKLNMAGAMIEMSKEKIEVQPPKLQRRKKEGQ